MDPFGRKGCLAGTSYPREQNEEEILKLGNFRLSHISPDVKVTHNTGSQF